MLFETQQDGSVRAHYEHPRYGRLCVCPDEIVFPPLGYKPCWSCRIPGTVLILGASLIASIIITAAIRMMGFA